MPHLQQVTFSLQIGDSLQNFGSDSLNQTSQEVKTTLCFRRLEVLGKIHHSSNSISLPIQNMHSLLNLTNQEQLLLSMLIMALYLVRVGLTQVLVFQLYYMTLLMVSTTQKYVRIYGERIASRDLDAQSLQTIILRHGQPLKTGIPKLVMD